MRTEEQVERQYRNYVKLNGKNPSAFYYGAACALGMTLGKTLLEIEADLRRSTHKFKS